MNWEMFWNALSAVGTIIASITALYIVKWNDKLSKVKKLSIKWDEFLFIPSDTDVPEKEYIQISLINMGNRKIVVESMKYKLTNIPGRGPTSWMDEFPLSLEIEEKKDFTFTKDSFKKWVNDGIMNHEILRTCPNRKRDG